jgi:hypothetical protein
MEEEDLIDFYTHSKGDVRLLLESIPLSVNEDIPRFVKFYEESITSKKIKNYKIFEMSKDKVFLLKVTVF